jgi:hypothetical protein
MADDKTRFRVFHVIDHENRDREPLEERLNEWWSNYSSSWNRAEIVALAATAGMVVVAYKSEEEDIDE